MLRVCGVVACLVFAGCRDHKRQELPVSLRSHSRLSPDDAISILKEGHDQDAEVRGKFPHLSEHIIPSHEEAHAIHPNGDEGNILDEAIRCNVRRSIKDLLKISDGVRLLAEAGKIKIVGAVYDIRSGQVEWLPDVEITPKN